jgi:diguanylate cyclase (GGDEF)-like protein
VYIISPNGDEYATMRHTMSTNTHSKTSEHAQQSSQNAVDVILLDSENSSLHQLFARELSDVKIIASLNMRQIVSALTMKPAPSLIIINTENETIDGFNALIRLKQQKSTSNTPVVLVSAHENAEDRIRAFSLGCDDFISLPLRNDELKARIQCKMRLHAKQSEIQQLAYHDELTGIMNRRGYNQALSAEWGRCRRAKTELSMLLIDIDDFKYFNDTYGHKKGDELIQYTANTLKKICTRSSDLSARFGGDEFVVLLSDTNQKSSAQLAELIINEFSKSLSKNMEVVPAPEVSISIGIACLTPSNKNTPIDLFNNADQALYQAKSLGKNTWQIAR